MRTLRIAGPPKAEPPRFIAIEGPPRTGKTSLADVLAGRLHAARLRDVEDNPFLESFYRGKPGAAFQTQLYFLWRRFRQWQNLDQGPKSKRMIISDYLFAKDKIFACLNLEKHELELYEQYHALFAEQVPAPDLVIYLQARSETLKRRAAKKRVPAGQEVEDIEEVAQAYEHFFLHYKDSDLLVVESSKIDFIERNRDLQELLARLSQPVKGTQYFLPIGSASAD